MSSVTESLLQILGEEVVPSVIDTLSEVFGLAAEVYRQAGVEDDAYGLYSSNDYETTPYWSGYLLVNGLTMREMAGSGAWDSISRDEVIVYTTTRFGIGDRVLFTLPSGRKMNYVVDHLDEDWSTYRGVYRIELKAEHQD